MQEGRNHWGVYVEQLALVRQETRVNLTVMEAREIVEPNLALSLFI